MDLVLRIIQISQLTRLPRFPAKAGIHFCRVGVDGPRRHRCARMRSLRSQRRGTVRGEAYPNWYGHVEASLSAAWCQRGGGADPSQEVAAQGDGGVFPAARADG